MELFASHSPSSSATTHVRIDVLLAIIGSKLRETDAETSRLCVSTVIGVVVSCWWICEEMEGWGMAGTFGTMGMVGMTGTEDDARLGS